MMPIVFNEYPSRLVQLTMNGSVGAGGFNEGMDVILVQSLLNAVPSDEAGPEAPLAVDGLVGPLTIGAIRRYQEAHTKVVDGRADVGGPTIMALVRGLNARNALPRGLHNLGPPMPEIVRSLTYPPPTSTQSRLDLESTNCAMPLGPGNWPNIPPNIRGDFDPTGWKIVTSGGFDLSVLYGGLTSLNIYMTHDTEPGLTYCFTFLGPGVGLSLLPIGLDVSFAEMPSWGTTVRIVPYSPWAKNPPFNAKEFDLLPTSLLCLAGNVGPGWSGTLICFGNILPLPVLPTRYVAAMTGMQMGLPGVNITLFAGSIAGWT